MSIFLMKPNFFKMRPISAEIRIFESSVLKILVKTQQADDMFCCARKMLQMTHNSGNATNDQRDP